MARHEDGSPMIEEIGASPSFDVTAAVLAGGEAARMGGTDKGTILFRGRPLVEHVLERLKGQGCAVVISANRNLDFYRSYGHPVITDGPRRFTGPLAGLAAVMADVTTEWVALAPCDSPFLTADSISRLLHRAPSGGAAAARAEGRPQPVFCLVSRQLRTDLEQFLRDGGRRVREFLERNAVAWVDFPSLSAFENFNTPDDIRRFTTR